MSKVFPREIEMLAISCLILLLLSAFPGHAETVDPFREAREGMVRLIEKDVQDTRSYIDRQQLDPRVMAAMASVPRHLFVPEERRDSAYENRPLPIGYGQTISQPYIVALMTDLLAVKPGDKVLEVGTGSAYQAAILAWLGAEVYTMEIIPPLAAEAKEKLERLPPGQVVRSRAGDGYYGWNEHGPYQGIMVTAASSHVPPPLIKQLAPGGRMIIPVGSGFQTQQLLLLVKDDQGGVTSRQILPVVFVPLTGSGARSP
jgi:protein-L-isoaspartate(D-aspartate) O-methyltransferase